MNLVNFQQFKLLPLLLELFEVEIVHFNYSSSSLLANALHNCYSIHLTVFYNNYGYRWEAGYVNIYIKWMKKIPKKTKKQ